MTVPILQKDASVLRLVAVRVDPTEIRGQHITETISAMREALHVCDDGLAIAAPQIGISLQIFVVAGRYFPSKKLGSETPDLVFINPTITKRSSRTSLMNEGCLSVRWLYGETMRHEKVTIQAYNEAGKKITSGASGLLAQVFQHEIDHLNGILFIDTAHNLQEIVAKQETTEKDA